MDPIKNFVKLVFSIIILSTLACNGSGKYADFETDVSGLKYKFIEEAKNSETISSGDFVELELIYKAATDSVLFNSKELRAPFRMQMSDISHAGGSFENAVFLCHLGEKIQFVLSADSFYLKTRKIGLPKGIEKGSDLFFELKIIRKLTFDEIEKERAQFLDQLKEQETLSIKSYLTDNSITVNPSKSGLYIINKKQGKGAVAKPGRVLTVHYIGKFIDGRVFDSSYGRNEPFEFELGAKQVIDAWEEGCAQMREGDKVLLIAPSALAYGKDGYGQLILPFSPLVFEIELLAVN